MAKRARTRNNSPVNKAPSVELKMLKSEFSDAQLEHYLNKGTIDSLEEIDTPPQILWVEDCTIATFGNFSASTGKAKSKKTFNISAMVAAALINGKVLNYRASLPEGKRKILYFDTEQSRYHCQNVLNRILKLAGLKKGEEVDLLTFVELREYTPTLRISLIDYALRKSSGYGLVIIDGLRDLVYDINNAKESTDVMTLLMSWTSAYCLHERTSQVFTPACTRVREKGASRAHLLVDLRSRLAVAHGLSSSVHIAHESAERIRLGSRLVIRGFSRSLEDLTSPYSRSIHSDPCTP